MRPRYVVRADATYLPPDECSVVGATAIDVYEREQCEQPTGLLDAMGRPLFGVERRRPIGFIHFGGDE